MKRKIKNMNWKDEIEHENLAIHNRLAIDVYELWFSLYELLANPHASDYIWILNW